MKSISKTRIVLARARTARALTDYSRFSTNEMLSEIADLHEALVEAEQGIGFSPAARHGIRTVIVRQLLAIDDENRRRTDRHMATAA